MQEAKFSINIKYNWRGYDSQITLRSDDDCNELIKQSYQVIAELEKLGVTGQRRWEAAKNGSGKETQALPKPKSQYAMGTPSKSKTAGNASASSLAAPEAKGETGSLRVDAETACPLCGVVGDIELIGFYRGDVYRQAWKCQACGKWLPQ